MAVGGEDDGVDEELVGFDAGPDADGGVAAGAELGEAGAFGGGFGAGDGIGDLLQEFDDLFVTCAAFDADGSLADGGEHEGRFEPEADAVVEAEA